MTRKKSAISVTEGPQTSLTFLHTGQQNCPLPWVQFWHIKISSRHCLQKLWEQERSSTAGVNSSMHTGQDSTAPSASMASAAACLSQAARPHQASRTGAEYSHVRQITIDTVRLSSEDGRSKGSSTDTWGTRTCLCGGGKPCLPAKSSPQLFFVQLTSHKCFYTF